MRALRPLLSLFRPKRSCRVEEALLVTAVMLTLLQAPTAVNVLVVYEAVLPRVSLRTRRPFRPGWLVRTQAETAYPRPDPADLD